DQPSVAHDDEGLLTRLDLVQDLGESTRGLGGCESLHEVRLSDSRTEGDMGRYLPAPPLTVSNASGWGHGARFRRGDRPAVLTSPGGVHRRPRPAGQTAEG